MAAPTVTGAVALYKSSRPNATPAEVREALRYLGNLGWTYWTDPDPTHEPLLDVSRIGPLGTFDFAPGRADASRPSRPARPRRSRSRSTRSATFFERVQLSITFAARRLDRRHRPRPACSAGPRTAAGWS